jgi:hypothetical protein
MTRLFLLPLLALAACSTSQGGPVLGSPVLGGSVLGRVLGQPGEPEAPPPLPPQVLAALPAGVPPSVVTRNADGCYLITLERTDPPTGYPLTDAAGNPVCEGDAGTALAAGPIAPPNPA